MRIPGRPVRRVIWANRDADRFGGHKWWWPCAKSSILTGDVPWARALDTECGINRVAVRSTLAPGTITVTTTREGLAPATIKFESKPVEIVGGLTRALPPTQPSPR